MATSTHKYYISESSTSDGIADNDGGVIMHGGNIGSSRHTNKSILDIVKGADDYVSMVKANTGTANEIGITTARSDGTLAYNPNDKIYNKYKKLENKKVGVFIKGYRSNDHIDALWVDNMFDKDGNKIKRHDKGAAHITLSHKTGYKSGDANTMFTNPKVKDKKYGYVEGTINYIDYDKR